MNRLKRMLVLYLTGAGLLYASEQSRAPRLESQKAAVPQVPLDADVTNNSGINTNNSAIDFHNITMDDLLNLIAMKLNTPGSTMLDGVDVTYITETDVLSGGYSITKPGYYTLSASVDVIGTATSIIRIATSNVVLDLHQQTLYQSGIDAELNGIVVEQNLTNVVIKNGKISNMTGHGISIGDDSHDIIVSDIIVRGCGGNGIWCKGTSTNNNKDIIILNSEFSHNGSYGGIFTYTDKVKINATLFNNNIRGGASFSNSANNEIGMSNFCNNKGSGAVSGLELKDVAASRVKGCIFNSNTSTTDEVRGLLLAGAGNVIEDCVSDSNETLASSFAIGFDIEGTANRVKNCSATANSSNQKGIGFSVRTNTKHCFLKNCTAIANSHRGFENLAPYGANVFLGNFSFGQGSLGNYRGAGIGFVVMGVAAQVPARCDDQRFENVSVV